MATKHNLSSKTKLDTSKQPPKSEIKANLTKELDRARKMLDEMKHDADAAGVARTQKIIDNLTATIGRL